jgi:hypothetical protein
MLNANLMTGNAMGMGRLMSKVPLLNLAMYSFTN